MIFQCLFCTCAGFLIGMMCFKSSSSNNGGRYMTGKVTGKTFTEGTLSLYSVYELHLEYREYNSLEKRDFIKTTKVEVTEFIYNKTKIDDSFYFKK